MICRARPDGTLAYVNTAYADYFCKTRAELEGTSFLSLIPEADRERVQANLASLTVDSPTQSHEHEVIAPGGETGWHRWSNRALFDDQGRVVAYQSVGEDVTDRKRAEEGLRRSEKMQAEAEKLAATGRMAAQIAHEINNPLAGIKNSFRLIKDAIPKDHPDRDMVGRIEREIDRIAHVVRQMYKLHAPRAQTPTDIPVEEAIQDVLLMLEPLRREHEVAVSLAPVRVGLSVRAPQGSLQQVLYNLVANAIEASPRNGAVTVFAQPADENSVRISVQDQGPGIPDDLQDRMFEPFFSADTGSRAKEGIGLGLSVVKSIVESLEGNVEVESRLGEGTCFSAYLPSGQP